MDEVDFKLYKVGDYYTSTKSKVTGKILEIEVLDSLTVRVKLEVEGAVKWTTWKAK